MNQDQDQDQQNLKELVFNNFVGVSLPSLRHYKAKDLIITSCPNLKYIPDLPNKLRSLDIEDCKNLTKLPYLPSSLLFLQINTTNIKLDDLSHTKLRNLSCINNPNLHVIPPLPPTLKKMVIAKTGVHAFLSEFPNSLVDLDITYCKRLKNIPQLPEDLDFIRLIELNEDFDLPLLPSLSLTGAIIDSVIFKNFIKKLKMTIVNSLNCQQAYYTAANQLNILYHVANTSQDQANKIPVLKIKKQFEKLLEERVTIIIIFLYYG